MSRRIGRGLSADIKWKVVQAPEDDWTMLGRMLPQNEAKQALVSGLYSDGTVIEINSGNWLGRWKVVGRNLVDIIIPTNQLHFDSHAKLLQSKQEQLVLM